MNVFLFHFGRYDDRQENFKAKYPLYYKCFEQIKNEFKDDNIVVFYSYDDVYKKFPQIKVDLEKYNDFLSAIQADVYRLDLVRCLMTKYCEDMLYLDSDVYIENGFKESLLENIKNSWSDLFFESDTMAVFYSRKPAPIINVLLKRFTKNYTYDIDEIKLSKINTLKSKGNFDRSKLEYIHYGGLGFLKTSDVSSIEKVDDSVFSFKPEITNQEKLYLTNDKALIYVCSRYNFIVNYFFSGVTVEELLITVGKQNLYYEMS